MEWLTLLLLVPAIVVPVVLLWGFAGCEHVFPLTTRPPAILSADGIGVSTITLVWSNAGDETKVEVERSLGGEVQTVFEASSNTVDDTGLDADTTYSYRVRAVPSDDDDWSPAVEGKTLSFQVGFTEDDVTGNQPLRNRCIVQRIEAVRLRGTGTQVKITVRRPTVHGPIDGGLEIKRIFISQPHPDPARDLYDPAGDLTVVVSTPLFLPQQQLETDPGITLPQVPYNWDRTKALLIAFEIGDPGNVPFVDHVPPKQAVAFVGPGGEAKLPDRTPGYSADDERIYLVEQIEVG